MTAKNQDDAGTRDGPEADAGPPRMNQQGTKPAANGVTAQAANIKFSAQMGSHSPTGLIGPYEVLKQLTQTHEGQVLVGRHESMKRQVILKEAPKNQGDSHKRLVREAEALALCKHPNIVTAYDLLDINGSSILVLEYIGDTTLESLLCRDKREGVSPDDEGQRLRPETAATIGLCVASALEHAHSHKIIHRDIKPANIMVTMKGEAVDEVKLIDFNAAKVGGLPTITTTSKPVVGTYPYMSPEQLKNKPTPDHRTDIFSLGAVLYEALSGRRAFQGDTPEQILTSMHDLKPLEDLGLELPEDLTGIVMKALAFHPEDRFQNAADLRQELALFLRSRASPMAQATNPPKGNEWFKNQRHLRLVVGGLAILAALFIGAIWTMFSGQSSRQEQKSKTRLVINSTINSYVFIDGPPKSSQDKVPPPIYKVAPGAPLVLDDVESRAHVIEFRSSENYSQPTSHFCKLPIDIKPGQALKKISATFRETLIAGCPKTFVRKKIGDQEIESVNRGMEPFLLCEEGSHSLQLQDPGTNFLYNTECIMQPADPNLSTGRTQCLYNCSPDGKVCAHQKWDQNCIPVPIAP